MMEHSGTHVDAICHQAEDLKFYGCHDADDYESVNGFSVGDAAAIPVFHHPGVLIDLVRDNDGAEVSASALISLEQVQRAARKQNALPAPGEVALIRTGNGRYWNDSERYLNGPGMSPDVSQWLADLGVVAVGADNMAWDLQGYVDPKVNCDLPGHVILLVRSGIHIFENVNLERLGDAGVGRFTFFAAPLQLRGATGSPIRPIAVLEGENNEQ